MPLITDIDDVEITYLSFSQEESVDSAVFVVKVPCLAGQVLKAEANADVSVLGRPSGVGSYVDLTTDAIDLTPYDGTNQAFDLKLHTNAVSGLVSTSILLRATSHPDWVDIIRGVGRYSAPAIQISAAGVVADAFQGVGDYNCPQLQLSGAGIVEYVIEGLGDTNAPQIQINGAGAVQNVIGGVGDYQRALLQLSGAGVVQDQDPIGGAGDFNIP